MPLPTHETPEGTPAQCAPTRTIPELLAPAGSFDALVGAVANGADAVYLGTGELNARRSAVNFSLEELSQATRYAHLRGVRVYVTANVLILPGEMDSAMDLVAIVWAAGADAIIVQDLGLLRRVRAELPEVRVHASTQMNTHDTTSIRMLADAGVARITLAREMSLERISAARDALRRLDIRVDEKPVELESFVHGALCYSYSGQCLMSSMIGARSANRGLCAQPCRLPYELVDEAGKAGDVPGRHLLSPKDLAGISLLPQLIAAGVSALKIEGRMKAPEYVALVTGAYRKALDRAAADPEGFSVTEAEEAILAEAFNRGFTQGHMTQSRGAELMSWTRPNNRGVPLGRVTSAAPGSASVSLDKAVDVDDTVEFWTGAGRFAQRVGKMLEGGREVRRAPAGAIVTLVPDKSVRAGDRVFRVANAELLAAARRSFADAEFPFVSVDVRVGLRIGQPLQISLLTQEGLVVTAKGSHVESARTKAVTADEIVEHVGRFGGTPYRTDTWAVDLDHGAGISFSELHRVRREAVALLDAALLEPWISRQIPRRAGDGGCGSHDARVVSQEVASRAGDRTPRLVVVAGDHEVMAACVDGGSDEAYLRVDAGAPIDERSAEASQGVALPRIAYDDEIDGLLAHVSQGGRAIAGTIGLLSRSATLGAPAWADSALNTTNVPAVEQLAAFGASGVWLSSELALPHVAEVAQASSLPCGVTVFGRLELMVMESCVLQALGPCARKCAACSHRRHAWWLKDRKDYRFPVRTDAAGRTHLYNAVRLDLSRALPEVVAAGVSAVRLEMTMESPEEARRITQAFRDRLDALSAGRPIPVENVTDNATSGHAFRGVR